MQNRIEYYNLCFVPMCLCLCSLCGQDGREERYSYSFPIDQNALHSDLQRLRRQVRRDVYFAPQHPASYRDAGEELRNCVFSGKLKLARPGTQRRHRPQPRVRPIRMMGTHDQRDWQFDRPLLARAAASYHR